MGVKTGVFFERGNLSRLRAEPPSKSPASDRTVYLFLSLSLPLPLPALKLGILFPYLSIVSPAFPMSPSLPPSGTVQAITFDLIETSPLFVIDSRLIFYVHPLPSFPLHPRIATPSSFVFFRLTYTARSRPADYFCSHFSPLSLSLSLFPSDTRPYVKALASFFSDSSLVRSATSKYEIRSLQSYFRKRSCFPQPCVSPLLFLSTSADRFFLK